MSKPDSQPAHRCNRNLRGPMGSSVIKIPKLPVPTETAEKAARKVGEAILNFVSKIPHTTKHKASKPALEAQNLIKSAATRAAITSGSLALPVGPLGMLTLIP